MKAKTKAQALSIGVVILAGLALGACDKKAAAPAAGGAPAQTKAPEVMVAVNDTACEPSSLTVPAGKTTFVITNNSSRALEWEILKGVLVVDERENIAPSFKDKLTTNLAAGEYEMTCGLLSNARGKLVVTPNANAEAGPSSDVLAPLAQPIADYKAYVQGETKALLAQTAAFVAAVKANDLKKAQALYAPTRAHYERIEPIADMFSDLDGSIDSRADAHKQKEKDPEFTGFHRLEYDLFSLKTTKNSGKIADKLLEDVKALSAKIDGLNFPPHKVVGGAGDLIEEVAKNKISGEEDRYSGTDLSDFSANIDGSKKIVDLLRPLIEKKDANLLKAVDANFADVDKVLNKYHKGDVWANYKALSDADRKALQAPITALAEDLSKLRGLLGLN